jgi:hypothetical protein
VETKEDREREKGYSLSFKAFAFIAILVLFLGGGWASLAPSAGGDPERSRAGIELLDLERSLSADAMGGIGAEEAAARALRLVSSARLAGLDPTDSLAAVLPEPQGILGMLALDRDIDDYLEYADCGNAGGEFYRDQARIAREMRPLRSRYEAVFAAASAALAGGDESSATAPKPRAGKGAPRPAVQDGRRGKPPYIAKGDEVWLPPRSELPYAHPYALDVFFCRVARNGEAERGPLIRSLYPGIVVVAAEGWSGGAGISAWKEGGLSPAAGNGVVVYDPSSRRYVSYFHLASVTVRKGELVAAGEALGRGGNSGMNARKAGHGEHVHVEIFDVARNESLSSDEILGLLER